MNEASGLGFPSLGDFCLLIQSPYCSVVELFSHSAMSNSLQPHVLQSISFTISWGLLKLMSIKSVMPSNHLILCCPLLLLPSVFPASWSFPMSQLFTLGSQSIGALALASVLPMNIQDWFPLELTGLISLHSKGLSRVFSNTTVQKHQFSGVQPLWSSSHIHIWLLANHSFDYVDLCWQIDVSAL